MRVRDDETGQVLVVFVLCLAVLIGFTALAIDVGHLLYTKRQLQTLADSAALAAAIEGKQCGSSPNCTAMQIAAKVAVTENGQPTPSLLTQCSGTVGTDLTLELNNGPCAMGVSDPNQGSTKYVEAVVFKRQNTFFGSLLGISGVTLSARSEAALGPSQFCVHVIDPSASQALLMNGSSSMSASCGVMVDSSSNTALLANGNATLSATVVDVHGQDLLNGNPSITPSPQLNSPRQADPLAGTPAPTVGSCTYNNLTVNGNSTQTLSPGVYCGGLNVNGGATVRFNSGMYILSGNTRINGNATISGTNVTFYIPTGQFAMNGAAHADLTAPTSGTYAGILFYQNKNDSSQFILNGDSTSKWQGAIYLPGAQLLLNGGSNLAAYTILDVATLTVNGNNTFTINSDYSSLPDGSPAQGSTAYLME